MSHKEILALSLLLTGALTIPPSVLLIVVLYDLVRIRKKLRALLDRFGVEVS